ncbi:hypothetical protein [[Mycoplasma] collis]|uniref:hypothetical protein n=1 Tax=[Mycoplasma] collis TaxID=2127 RepID=UPI000B27E5F9|nr:hypothetical protein [[Mycoplasma] collis]
MANNNRQDEEKRSKKKRIIALLAFLVGALGVSSASIPLFLERYNYHALPDAIKPKVKFSNDHDNGGKLSLELTPELAGKNVTAVFEDEHGNAHLIEDLTVGTDGKLVIELLNFQKVRDIPLNSCIQIVNPEEKLY